MKKLHTPNSRFGKSHHLAASGGESIGLHLSSLRGKLEDSQRLDPQRTGEAQGAGARPHAHGLRALSAVKLDCAGSGGAELLFEDNGKIEIYN